MADDIDDPCVDEGEDSGVSESKSNNEEQIQKWKCPINGCQSKLIHLKNNKRHMRNYHGIILPNGKYRRDRIKCLRCHNKIVLNRSHFNVHHELKHPGLQQQFKPITQDSIDRLNFK